ncbi:MAG: rhamnogalacturonan lyase [Muribaculaceae bacterium]|nr:rhamnogalacturonan lyase [Muribaculaceae bacterium]
MKTNIIRTLLIGSAMCLYSSHSYPQANYDFSKLKMESLGRGVVAVREAPDKVNISWRYLSQDPEDQSFDIYRNGKKINKTPITQSTYYSDNYKGKDSARYDVIPSDGKLSGSYILPAEAPLGYIEIPLDRPELGVDFWGKEYFYNANDASIGDVDGDGEYEIILKWDPTNSHDNAHDGFTGPTYLDCYKLDGTKLWRINLGENIRSGAHYIQFMVYDLDGDGCAEVVCKTSDGTIDGTNKLIGDHKADWRNMKGRIIAGPEYLTVFNGKTGEAMSSVDYQPARGQLKDWGDGYANRSERYLGAIAYLDGVHPSVVMCRGYYAKSALAAYDWDGKELKLRWIFDSSIPGNESYGGQGNHNLRVADVDGDGYDEIIYGQMTVDHDGTGLYSTGLYHGDAIHLLSDVNNQKYYVWGCHENKKDGTTLRDAATGEVILRYPSNKDIGRCMAADIDPTHEGVELWSPSSGGLRSFTGELISPQHGFLDETHANIPVNFSLLWDGDLLTELLDGNTKTLSISKYNWTTGRVDLLKELSGAASNNWTKANPCLQADIIGDWREEVIARTPDNESLRIYVTDYPTDYRFHTFMEDPAYRVSVANQNVAYNQPAEPGFYFGPDLKGRKFRGTEIK